MTSASDVLRAAFARHTWATLGLLDALEGLDPTRLDDAVPGTYGSIAQTLTHLVDADDRYLQRLVNPVLPPHEGHGVQPLAVLRDRVREHESRWSAMLAKLDAGTLEVRIDWLEDYPEVEGGETLLLIQALHHGDDHRAQVCSTLGALGLEVPDLDGWSYWLTGRA
jgi:Uncharacterized protein conserved in bacteria